MKRTLVAPLDWGLGHATRCIPIIKYLLEKKYEVVIGADGRPLQLLRKEFPDLEFVRIPGYSISYPRYGSMIFKIASQVPKILSGIKREHDLLHELIRKKNIDAVISDNRFGLWSKQVPCVFITHQLMVKLPFGEKLIHRLNKYYISKFTECWVPDEPHPLSRERGLSGHLSHKFSLPENAKYIGVLSRFSANNEKRFLDYTRNDILIILSGPEPQRTSFEKIIIEQLIALPASLIENKKVLIVQGITEKNERRKISDYVEIVSHLTSGELQEAVHNSEIVLSRPGYSTIMDMAVMSKKAIFVPTPGQTEQEYLAKYFLEKGIAYSDSQKKFHLQSALMESEKYSGFMGSYDGAVFKNAIDNFLKML